MSYQNGGAVWSFGKHIWVCWSWWNFKFEVDFMEDFSRKSYRKTSCMRSLPGSLLRSRPQSLQKPEHEYYQSLWCVCQVESKVIYVEDWSLTPSVIVIYGLLCDLQVYSFSCRFFCKLEDMLIKRIQYIFSCFPKVLDIIEFIDTTYQ